MSGGNAGDWALQYVDQVFPYLVDEKVPLLFAAEASFSSALALVCHVLKRGILDKTFGPLWETLLSNAEKDVEKWRAEQCTGESSKSPPLSA
jgi:hypothetical protein